MATKWIGSEHCLARVHCWACLSLVENDPRGGVLWREDKRTGSGAEIVREGIVAVIGEHVDSMKASAILNDPRMADPWPETFDIPEPVVCPYGVTLEKAYNEAVERAANNEISRDGSFLHRLTIQEQGEALVEMVAAEQLVEDVAVRVAEKLANDETATITDGARITP